MGKLYEATMQKWFKELDCIATAIDGIDWDDLLVPKSTSQNLNLASVQDARRVFNSLYDAGERSAEGNIAEKKEHRFLPDLLLFNDSSGAYIVVELKASAAAARQALTEVLGYAQEIKAQTNDAQVFIVIAAAEWSPLLDNAVATQLRSRHFPLLPLQFYEKDGFRLRLRIEPFLPRQEAIGYIDQSAFSCDTRSYFFQRRNCLLRDIEIAKVRIVEEMLDLAARGERTSTSGFVIAWRNVHAWNLSTCVVNSARLPLPDTANPLLDHNDLDWVDLDVGSALLDQVDECGLPDSREFSGQEGWRNQLRMMTGENAVLFDISMWGPLRDSLGAFKRNLVRAKPVCSDFNFSTCSLAHPFIWVPYLDEIMGLSIDIESPGLYSHYRLGLALGTAAAYYAGNIESLTLDENLGYLSAMGRLIDGWRRVFAHAGDACTAPQLSFENDGLTLRLRGIDHAIGWMEQQAQQAGRWPALAYSLGYACGLATRETGESAARRIFNNGLGAGVNVTLIEAARASAGFVNSEQGKAVLDYVEYCLREDRRFSYESLRFRMTCEAIIELAEQWMLFSA
jgi:hypothetical protein